MLTYEQTDRLIKAGFTAEDIKKLYLTQEEVIEKKEEPVKSEEPIIEKPVEKEEPIEDWKKAFAEMSNSIAELTQSIGKLQNKNVQTMEMPTPQKESVDDILMGLFN